MAIKIYFSTKIHRLAKLPESLQALYAQITSLFKSELPPAWVLQYVDSDGDSIIVSHEHDFKELVDMESATPSTTIKLYITPTNEGFSAPSIKFAPEEPAKLPDFVKYPDFGDYEVISQNNEEKPAIAEIQPQQQIEAPLPQVVLQPSKKDSKEFFKKAIELVKTLAKGKYPDTERNQLYNELNVLKANLNDEHIRRLDQKITEVEEKIAAKEARTRAKEAKEAAKAKKNLAAAPQEKIEEPLQAEEAEKKPNKEEKKCQEKNRPFEFKKFVQVLAALHKTQKEGKIAKANEFEKKLFKIVPEHARASLKSMLSLFSQEMEKDAMEACYFEEMKKFIEGNFPEEKDKFLEELEHLKQKRREQREQVQAKYEEKKKLVQKEKEYLVEKYSSVTFQRAMKMKIVFINEKVSTLCEYVSQKSNEASMEDLVLNYRQWENVN